jgi:multidrug efflux pump subunit AcrA (membrane-fusion protein)
MKSILFLIPLFLLACSQKQKTITPEKKSLVQSVYASATVVPKNSYSVNASVSGIVERLLVQVGDSVKIGDIIAKISDDVVRKNTENSKLNLELLKDKYQSPNGVLQQLQQSIELSELQLENDSINYFRQKKLWEQEIGSKLEFDTKKLQYELTKKKLIQLKSDYELKKKELKTQYKVAANQWETNQINQSDFAVKSRLRGVVYELYKEDGEWVGVQEPIALIGSSDWFVLELQIDERDIASIEIGQEVYLNLNAYPNESFEGTVSKVHPKMNSSTKTFLVEAEFKSFPKNLYMGLSGEANIVLEVIENSIIIPLEVIQNGNQVETSEGMIDIELGRRNLTEVQVLSGLDENTQILIPQE